jgi:hypothetical protein
MGKKTNLEVGLELTKINTQLLKQRKTISLKEANDLFLKAEKEVKSIENSEITEEIQKEMMGVFLKMLGLVGNYEDK